MFAPAHHQATRYVVPVRKELAVRTIFNFLGPLTNPAGARRQLIGVSDPAYLERMAGALARLGVDRALVVSSEDGLDEMSTSGPTHVVEVNGDADRALRRHAAGRRAGGQPPRRGRAAARPRSTPRPRARSSPASPAPRRDLALLNAGAAIYAGRRGRQPARGRRRRPRGGRLRRGAAHDRRLPRAVSGSSANGMSVLERIVDATRADVARRRQAVPLSELEQRAAGTREDRPFSEALTRPGISVIAEHKRRSPSAGEIRGERDGGRRSSAPTSAAARRRCRSSPRARHFGGSLDDLREARAASALPILRKDFIVDPYQVYESAVAGADAILLIVAALDDATSRLLHHEARRRWTSTSSSRSTTRRSSSGALEVVDADVIGINNRDLGDFTVDIERTYELLSDVPAGKTVVSESGFHDARPARRPRARGGRRGPRRRGSHARARHRSRLPCAHGPRRERFRSPLGRLTSEFMGD